MKDHAQADRQALIAGDKLAPSNEEKRLHALRYLGNRHVLHADYVFDSRHGSVETWRNHRTLKGIEMAAREAGRI